MYQVDGKDRVRELTDIPQSSVGAPIPVVIAGEQSLALVFYEEISDPEWDGSTARLVEPDTKERSVVTVRFVDCYAHLFGPPDNEIFSGHPLYERGLRAHRNFEVRHSSWIRAQEKMNAVHPFHPTFRTSILGFFLIFSGPESVTDRRLRQRSPIVRGRAVARR